MNDHDDSLIFKYTRREALEDGEQIDVSDTAREAGFCFPVFMTRAVWVTYVAVPDGVQGQDEAGRFWDILTMLRWQIKGCRGTKLFFRLFVRNGKGRLKLVELKAVCGPTDIDNPNPALTIMLPEED